MSIGLTFLSILRMIIETKEIQNWLQSHAVLQYDWSAWRFQGRDFSCTVVSHRRPVCPH